MNSMTPDHYNQSDFAAFEKRKPMIPDLSVRLLDMLIVVAGIFCFLLLLGYAQQKDLEDTAAFHKASAQRYASMLTGCLNANAMPGTAIKVAM